MSKPTLIFVPGAWHTPDIFDTIINKLSLYGYKSITVSLLAAGHEPAVPDLQPDIDIVHRAVLAEVDQGHDVMVIAHSWGGIVAGGSVDGLSKAERQKEGKKGGVVKMAYMCAFIPPEGVSLSMATGVKDPDWDIKGPWVTWKDPINGFYHDLPAAEAEYWKSKLVRHSYATFNVGATSAAWKTIPSWYLICEDDRAISVHTQELMVKNCEELGVKIRTERLFCSHSPFMAKPDETVGFLRRAAGELLETDRDS